MCGISGRVHRATDNFVSPELIKAMCEVMSHRGPDEDGFYFHQNVGLGMRRLKVIDLSTGSQPLFNEDKTVLTVFNGEIYNYRELRAALEQQGHSFQSQSDTEVIVHLYEQYGDDFARHLNGMFAIALWDMRQQKLVLTRDRLGEKPLHYTLTDDGIAFASEIKSLTRDPEFRQELNPEALYHYFSFICVPAPITIYKSVRKLLPGYYLVYQNGNARIHQYWNVAFQPEFDKSEAYFASGLRELMLKSLKDRLISDVPLGAFLSGGIDSSIVVALMSQLLDRPVKTFSIGFKEDRYNELDYARVVAKKFKTEHHELVVEPNIEKLLRKIVWHFDEPFAGPSAIPTFLVSQLARQHVTVVLTGDGSDEIFLGYDSYAQLMKRRKRRWLPHPLKTLVATQIGERLPDGAWGKHHLLSYGMDDPRLFCLGLSERWKRELFSQDFLDQLRHFDSFSIFLPHLLNHDTEFLTRYGYLDTKVYLPDNVLVKVDRMSMANSLESRALFLDHEIVDYAARIPAGLKLKGRTSKYILKKSMADLLPAEILQRGKQGFALPVDAWFRGSLRPMIQEAVAQAKSYGVFNHDYLAEILDEHQRGRRNNQRMLWAYMMFHLWHQICFKH